jgi:hypothetical protein
MSQKMMIAVMATAIGFVAAGAASARGGGAHGGLHGMSVGAVTVNASVSGALTHQNAGVGATSTGANARTVLPVTLGSGAGTVNSPNASSGGASSGATGGASPSSPNGGGLNNLGANRNGADVSVTGDSSRAAGTNTAGASLSSGLPTRSKSDATTESAQSAEAARRRQADEEADKMVGKEAAKVDRVVNSICKGC